MDALRVVLVDPIEESRESIATLLGGLDAIWVAEVCKSYAAAAKAVAEQSPELLIVNLDADAECALGVIATVARQHPSTAILPASQERSGELILRTVRAGAREFLVLPADPCELLTAIGNLVQAPSNGAGTRPGGRLIVLTGAAGGVGCTSLAVNVSATLARDARRTVALADFDFMTGAVDACLDIVPNYTILEVAQNADRLDLMLLKRSMARHGSGLFVLPRPLSIEDAANVDPNAMHRVISLLKAAYSTVVIDASKALQAADFVSYEMADQILLIIQLEVACVRNTARLLKLFRQTEGMAEKVRLVVNRAGGRECHITPRKAEEILKLPISWTVSEAVHEFGDSRAKGVPMHAAFPRCKACKEIEEIARAVVQHGAEVRALDPQPVRRIAAMF